MNGADGADGADGAEGGDGDQHAGHWLVMMRLIMMGIFPANKMMVVFSKDICDISAYGIFLEGINYIYHFLFYYSYSFSSLNLRF